MPPYGSLVLLCLCHLQFVVLTEPPCVIDLQCAECVPDHMPLASALAAAHGDELALSCGAGRLLAFPLRARLAVRCEAGRYRVPLDGSLRHLLELGCQESVFEDVLHEVEHCSPPLRGRVYRLQEEDSSVRHLAALCYDEDRGLATFAHASNAPGNALSMPRHEERRAPLTLLGNFNDLLDSNTRSAAEKLYSDDVRMNRRLRELFKHDEFSFAGQTLTAATLLGRDYFEEQNGRVADFVSNKFAAWASVAAGNLAHVQSDVARLLRAARPHAAVHVYAGTHGDASLRAGAARRALRLRAGRFPAPRYVWTVLHEPAARRALALVVLNDPFVAVSEIREAVFCESACARVPWLAALRRHRNYETPLYGLTFCCAVADLAAVVPGLPAALAAGVRPGSEGLLVDVAA